MAEGLPDLTRRLPTTYTVWDLGCAWEKRSYRADTNINDKDTHIK